MNRQKNSAGRKSWKNLVTWHLKKGKESAINGRFPSYKGRILKKKKKE